MKKLKHITSKRMLALCVVIALCIGLTVCIGLASCTGPSSSEKPPSEQTSSTATQDPAGSDERATDELGQSAEDSSGRTNAAANSEDNAEAKDPNPSANSSKDDSSSKPSKKAPLTCTFLNVGQGDCSIIQCDGRYMMIDGGDPKASSKVYSYIQKNQITHFDYMVATHADADHVGGMAGALQLASVGTAYCSVTDSDKDAFQSLKKHLAENGVKLERPKTGKIFELGSAQVQVVAPARTDTSDNDDSLVLRVTYGKTSALFTGDAAEAEEDEMLSGSFNLQSNLLKVAHHGSATSSSARFLQAVSPSIAIISVGANNTYGHPTNEALSRLDAIGTKIYRTDLQGTITATSDGKTFTLKTQHKAKTPTNVSQSDQKASESKKDDESQYIGNAKSLKFHRPSCRSLPLERNCTYFESRKAATDAGYSPCGVCRP